METKPHQLGDGIAPSVFEATIPLCWPIASGFCGCGRGHAPDRVGKIPLLPSWAPYITAPPTETQVTEWRIQYPDANRGLVLNPLGLLVIDIDSDEALAEATSYMLPPAIVARTGRGRHYFYAAPLEVAGRRATKRGHSKAIDVLAGGLITIPPSRHRNGQLYQWIVGPRERLLPTAPGWAVKMLTDTPPSIEYEWPVALPTALSKISLDGLHISPRIRTLIEEGTAARYPSRSEAVFAVLQALIHAGYDDATIAAILSDCRYAISAKPRERGRLWLAHEIARARARAEVFVVL